MEVSELTGTSDLRSVVVAVRVVVVVVAGGPAADERVAVVMGEEGFIGATEGPAFPELLIEKVVTVMGEPKVMPGGSPLLLAFEGLPELGTEMKAGV